MCKPIQLKLWPDHEGRVLVTCDHCGHPTNARPQLEQQQRDVEERVLSDPRVKALRGYKTRYAFFEAALPVFLFNPEPVGISQIALETDYSTSGTYRHVQSLVRCGILSTELKRQGGTYRQYRLTLPNGHIQN